MIILTNNEVVNLSLIKELREKNNISIDDMSKRIGYEGYQAYYNKERGIRKLSAEDIARIASVLKVQIKDLFLNK